MALYILILASISIVFGIVISVGMWLHNGMADKVLGWHQFIGWPMVGVGLVVVGVIALFLR